jgi:hypothetical protein
MVSQLIVKPRAPAGAGLSKALQAFDAGGLSKNANVPMRVIRAMSGNGYVVRLDRPVKLSEARVISRRLMRNDGGVEYAEPDRVVHPTATEPSDPVTFLINGTTSRPREPPTRAAPTCRKRGTSPGATLPSPSR